MDVERLARKLEPLMPDRVRHWLRVRATADGELKSLLDKQIIATAHRVLGDLESRPLLSLPPADRVQGEIVLGQVLYDRERWPFGLKDGELLQNLGIFGRSGSGKTTIVFHLLQQLNRRHIPWLFFDWKRTARHLLPQLGGKVDLYTPGRSLSPLTFNPFTPPQGWEPKVYFGHITDALAHSFTLGDGARSLIHRALLEAHSAGGQVQLKDVAQRIEAIRDRERVRGWKTSALRALDSLSLAITNPEDGSGASIERMLERSSILELDSLTAGAKAFLTSAIALWVFASRLAAPDRENLRLVLIVEEAHHLLHQHEHPAAETTLEMLLRQCRELGIGMIVVDQHPGLISQAVTGNIYASICLNLRDPRDINRAASISSVADEDKKFFSTLRVGQGIVKLQDRWQRPFLVQFPRVAVAKGAMTDRLLARFLRENRSGTGGFNVHGGRRLQIRQDPGFDDVVDADGLRFIDDVLAHPEDGVRARYERLGVSGSRGHRLKERLIVGGWLEAATVPVGRTRKVVLRLAHQAREFLGADAAGRGLRQESIAHEYWKNFYARELTDDGWSVAIESSVEQGNVDIAAKKGEHRLAIEIETGRSQPLSNAKRCLRAGFDVVIVVVTEKHARQRIEEAFARAGLILPRRVQIIDAGEKLPGSAG